MTESIASNIDNTENRKLKKPLAEAEAFSLFESLASMMKHEFHDPLNVVMRLISDSSGCIEDCNPAKQYLSEAEENLQRIASLVGSLIGFSPKASSLDCKFAPLNLIIGKAASSVRGRNGSANIPLRLRLAPDSPNVRTDDFYQVIFSLLLNAFDAVTIGSGSVNVETRLDRKDLHIIVEDNGCGIPEQIQPLIFDALFTTKEPGKGTGLGLAIVKKIVEKYDGKIALSSKEMVGTKIHAIFPVGRL